MTIIALHSGVCTQQGKTILVVLQLLYGNVPPLNRVTLRTIRAHPPLMDVLMAVLTVFSHVGENRFDMTLRAFHFFMHAAQRITGFRVIKFRNRADGTPTCGGVAVLARNRQGPMWALGGLPLWLTSKRICGCRQEQEKTTQ